MAGTENQHNNSGPGDQFVAAGPQNNNSGSGSQYNAHTINFNGAVQDSDASLFADLRITDPRDDKDRIEHTKGGLLRDSYWWILENPDFQEWRNDSEKRLLWVKGDPGKGKTMLLCGLINELANEGAEPVYIFCQATDSRLNTATAVLRGLIYLLLERRPSLIQFVREQHRHGGKRFFEDANSWTALGKILVQMLSQEDQAIENIVLIIDALDECTTHLDDLVDLVIKLSSTPAGVIVTSRNWRNIQEGMEAAEQRRQICLELNGDSVSAAVLTYTNHKVAQLTRQKGYDEALRTKVQRYLLSNSDGTFLWVSLVTQQLEDRGLPRRRTLTRLREFPQGLDALYRRMLDQALESKGQVLKSQDVDIRKTILAVVLVAFRPLNLKELATLIQPSMEDESILEVIDECGSLLVLRDNIVYFVHQSTKDFLVKYCLHEVMPLGIDHQHTLLFSNSLRAMSNTLRQNIYNLTFRRDLKEEVETPDPDPLTPIKYSCVRWAQHLSEGLPITAQQFDQVLAFLAEHFLHWLEVMSLIQMLDEGIACIIRLEHLAQNSTELSRLAPLFRDAFRFVKYFRTGIENDPLQVYSSVLFAPARSIIKNQYQHDAPHWWSMQIAPPLDDEWSKCLQTIEFSQAFRPRSAVFSSDGKVLALDPWGILQVRDADTGGWLNEFQTRLRRSSILATFGGHILAAAGQSGVRLFDMLTGDEMGNWIESWAIDFSSIAFAPHGAILATGSTEGALLLWDIQTGKCQRTLQANGQKGSIRSIAFSSNGNSIAAAVGSIVVVWDVNTGCHLRTFVGHEGQVLLVGFTSDNNRVQSASSDGAVKIWDMTNSSCLATINISVPKTGLMAFSNDRTRVASVNDLGNVQLWDAATGCLLGTLKQNGGVQCLAFSPDDTILMSATCVYYTIKFWDLAGDMGSSRTPLGQEDQSIHSMAFSSDGTQLAVVSAGALQVWDANSGQCLRKLDEWKTSRGVASVTFGNDGILLARTSGRNGGVVELWNVCTRTCLLSLEGMSMIVGLEFSPDSATLAILTINTIGFWDVAGSIYRVVYSTPRLSFSSNNVKFSDTGSHLYPPNWRDGENAIRWEKQMATAPMEIDVAPLEPLHISGYSIQESQAWVKKNGKYIIWIPPEYRTSIYATWGSEWRWVTTQAALPFCDSRSRRLDIGHTVDCPRPGLQGLGII
ncbi:nacht and wd domain protein [Colletotrichum camelliae]|nr:nacht and wd domain protein [Colletotrichum camelliae]